MTLTFLTSQRGEKILLHNGYMYYKKVKNKKTVTWRCYKARKFRCGVLIHTNSEDETGNVLHEPSLHSHAAETNEVECKKIKSKIKQFAISSNENPSAFVTKTIKNAVSQEAAALLPKTESIWRNIHRLRQKGHSTSSNNISSKLSANRASKPPANRASPSISNQSLKSEDHLQSSPISDPPPVNKPKLLAQIPEPNNALKKNYHFMSNGDNTGDDFSALTTVWINKLRSLNPVQKMYAEKAINDVLFEAEMGTLHRDSIQINRKDPPYVTSSVANISSNEFPNIIANAPQIVQAHPFEHCEMTETPIKTEYFHIEDSFS